MKRMSVVFLLLGVPVTGWAQLPGKDLAFAQIAFGGGYETVLNLTNRGTSAYNGSLTLLPSDPARPFPVRVNGNPLAGAMKLALDAGSTASLIITSGDVSGDTFSGFATIAGTNRNSPALLEGNLIYYVKSASGAVMDSVGVAPSSRLLKAVIPFDDFQSVALALARFPGGPEAMPITLTLFDDKGVRVASADQALAPSQHTAKFLYQFFPAVTLTKGRVEIRSSDRPFIGTALTFARGGQASAMPFVPSMTVYEVTATVGGDTEISNTYMALEGNFVKSYDIDPEDAAGSVEILAGMVVNGDLVVFFREAEGGDSMIGFVLVPGFSPAQAIQTGSVFAYQITNSSGAVAVFQGTVTLRALN
jgi:hypothetical protein